MSDSFELYDLKVEVVAPEGAKIWCGAKPGDHFVLQGEMLTLPPGQVREMSRRTGFSG